MRKTLLLCFIHGFKGGDDTFGSNSEFSQHLATLLSVSLPRIDVRAVTYPRYETRGDLHECVSRFRDWLLEKVIDIEVQNGTPSPTVDPGVRVILVGHSMGGIVAVETAMSISSDQPIKDPSAAAADGDDSEQNDHAKHFNFNGLMFPYIQGVLAFDTPYLGISPGVVAHGAEGHYNSAAAAWSQLSGIGGAFWGAGAAKSAASTPPASGKTRGALPPAQSTNSNSKDGGKNSAGGGGWGSWSKLAVAAGAAGALVAGGTAAYMNRDTITDGWSWVGSHLEFVGCLARGEELRKRTQNMTRLSEELGVGFANLYTRLGKAAAPKQVSMVGTVMGNERTFCNLPKKRKDGSNPGMGVWMEAINDMAKDETGAHMAMFEPTSNPGYSKLSEDAKNLIVGWTKNEWYETSSHDIEAAPEQQAWA